MSKDRARKQERERESAAADRPDFILTILAALLAATRLIVSGTIYPWTNHLLAAGFALLLILLAQRHPERLRLRDPWLTAGLALYFAAALVSVPCSLQPALSWRFFLYHLGDLLLFLAIRIGAPKTLRPLALALLAAGALSALFALRQRFGGFAATMQTENVTEFAQNILKEGRVFGFTFSPDMMAAILAGLIPLVLAFLVPAFRRSRGGEKTMAWAGLAPAGLLLLLAVVLVLTRSVGGYLAVGGGVMAYWLIRDRTRERPETRNRRLAVALILAGIFVAGAFGLMVARGGHLLDLDDPENPAGRRLDNWRTALRVVREFPLAGAGGGQYGLAMLYHRSLKGNEARHVHSAPLEVLAETGPLGLMGFLLVLLGFLRRVWVFHLSRASRSNDQTRGPAVATAPPDPRAVRELQAGFLAGGIAVLLHSMIDFDWATPEVAALFWIAAAAADREAGEETAPAAPGLFSSRPLRVAFFAGLALTAAVEFMQMQSARLRLDAVEAAREGKWPAARDLARRALRLSPASDDMYELLANAELTAAPRDPQARKNAVADLHRAMALNPRYPYYHRDLAFIQKSDPDDRAGESLQKAVSLYPNSLDLNLLLGRRLREKGLTAKAKTVLDHAAACGFANGEVLFELGLLAAAEGKNAEAEQLLRRSVEALPLRGRRAVALAGFLMNQNRQAEAIQLLSDWVAKHPDDPAAAKELKKLVPPPPPSPPKPLPWTPSEGLPR